MYGSGESHCRLGFGAELPARIGACHTPVIASMSPSAANGHDDRARGPCTARAPSCSAHVCMSRFRAITIRSKRTRLGRSGMHRMIPSIVCANCGEATASLVTTSR